MSELATWKEGKKGNYIWMGSLRTWNIPREGEVLRNLKEWEGC